MGIEYAGKGAGKYKPNSFFPLGTSVEQAVELIEQAINHPKDIIIDFKGLTGKISCDITSKFDQMFTLYIENNIATMHPLNPAARIK